MATENKMLMEEARISLRGKWGLAVGFWFIYAVITTVLGGIDDIGPLLQIIIAGPLLLGVSLFSLAISRGQEAGIPQLFEGFKEFLRTFVAYLLMSVYILLWALLLVVPGVIAALSYAQVFFIMAEDKSISASDALKKSKAMMDGHKKKLFYLILRFFGWFLLSILTLGIGFLWSLPYLYVALAKFYDDISKSVPQVAPTPA